MLKTFQGFYAQKDYANALLVLQKNQKAIDPGLWHYNVGTVKAKTLNWAEARFHFLKARQEGFSSEENFQNLTMTEEKLEVGKLEQPLSVSDYLIRYSLWGTQGAFTSLSLLILVGGIIHLRQKWKLGLAAVYGVLMVCPILFSLWVKSWPRAIVLAPQMVQDGPSVIFNGRTELTPGVFIVFDDEGDWKKIVYPSRYTGWIKANGIKSLENE